MKLGRGASGDSSCDVLKNDRSSVVGWQCASSALSAAMHGGLCEASLWQIRVRRARSWLRDPAAANACSWCSARCRWETLSSASLPPPLLLAAAEAPLLLLQLAPSLMLFVVGSLPCAAQLGGEAVVEQSLGSSDASMSLPEHEVSPRQVKRVALADTLLQKALHVARQAALEAVCVNGRCSHVLGGSIDQMWCSTSLGSCVMDATWPWQLEEPFPSSSAPLAACKGGLHARQHMSSQQLHFSL